MAVYKRDIVDINLETGNIHRSFLKHSIGYKDQKADHFGIRTYRDGVPVDLTGVSVQGIFLPPQGDPIAITSGNIVDGNVAEVVLPQACYNYDGQFTLSIKLVDSNNSVTGTMRIVDGMVDNTHASGTVAPTSAVPTYQEILATYDAMVAATTAATTAATNVGSIVAAAYSTSATYAVGDYCTKDGNLYRCTTAITTAESWTAAHWTQTKMGPDVSDLKNAIYVKTVDSVLTTGKAFRADTVSETSGTTYEYAKYEIQGETAFVVYGRSYGGSGKWPMISYLNNNNEVIKTEYLESGYFEMVRTDVPSNAVYIIVNGKTTDAIGATIYAVLTGSFADDITRIDKVQTSLKSALANDSEAQDSINKCGFFNIFDKYALIPNRRWKVDGEFGPPDSGNYSAYLLTIDQNRDSSLGRIRSSQNIFRAVFFNSSMEVISYSNNDYGEEIPEYCYYIGLTYDDDSTNYNTLMIAYTSETSGKESNLWDSIFPDVGYVPYRQTDYNQIYSKSQNAYLPEIISGIKTKTDLIGNNFDTGFNIFDGTYFEGKGVGYSEASTRGYYHVNDPTYCCTGLIKVDDTKGTRVRVSVSAHSIIAYDANLNLVRSRGEQPSQSGDARYPKALEINGVSYVAITFNTSQNVDFSTLMVAYTNENSGAYNNTWSDVFPGMPYKPYELIPKEQDAIPIEETLMERLGGSGAIVDYDVNNGYTATITGEETTVNSWGQVEFNVRPMQVVVVEFYGKKSGTGDGGGIIVEFFKRSGSSTVQIGSKYNGYVLGESETGYHRYGYVVPKAVSFARIRVFTYANSNIVINNLKVNILDCYPQREQAGIIYDGHLGMIYSAPRNTMPSLELGKVAGFSTMIVNVRPTSDNVLVCVHDATIDATSDGTGYVNAYTYNQLLAYDFGSWFDTIYTGTKVLKFEDAAKFLAVSGIGLGTSIHAGALSKTNIEEMCRIYKKYALNGRSFVKAFDFSVLEACYAILGDSVEYIYTGVNSTAKVDQAVGFPVKCTVEITSSGVTESLVNYALAAGVPVSVYFGNDMRQVREFIGLGVTRFVVDTFSDNVFPVV